MERSVLFVGGDAGAFSAVESALCNEPYRLAQANDDSAALHLLLEGKFDVVVADEQLPTGTGVSFLVRAKEEHPQAARILVLDACDRATVLEAVNQAEVFRLLLRPYQPAQLARALREALTLCRVAEAQEAVWLAARRQREVLEQLGSSPSPSDDAATLLRVARFTRSDAATAVAGEPIGELPRPYADRLSAREKEIVDALASGRRVKEIAQDLLISTHTVRNHIKAIYRKLNVRSQFELIGLIIRSH